MWWFNLLALCFLVKQHYLSSWAWGSLRIIIPSIFSLLSLCLLWQFLLANTIANWFDSWTMPQLYLCIHLARSNQNVYAFHKVLFYVHLKMLVQSDWLVCTSTSNLGITFDLGLNPKLWIGSFSFHCFIWAVRWVFTIGPFITIPEPLLLCNVCRYLCSYRCRVLTFTGLDLTLYVSLYEVCTWIPKCIPYRTLAGSLHCILDLYSRCVLDTPCIL